MKNWPRRLLYGLLFCAPVGLAGDRHWRAEQTLFLPGHTSSGHHQIEKACETCHTAFGGVDDGSCLACHGESLGARNDSHAPIKFDDPVRASQLTQYDARSCVACHREHRAEARLRGSVSVPQTFCVSCHPNVRQERPSHVGFDDAGCASAGCHNYHDNRALYRDFLVRQRGSEDLRPEPKLPVPAALRARDLRALPPPDLPERIYREPGLGGEQPHVWQARLPTAVREWATSAHARAQVNCTGCHREPGGDKAAWSWPVDDALCGSCHRDERLGFRDGKHGMRLTAGLAPMSPSLARIPMKQTATELTLGCNSCHGAHRFDRDRAAVSACEGCHDDDHTRAYRDSPHFVAWQLEVREEAEPGTGVSCATCHLPRKLAGHPGGRPASSGSKGAVTRAVRTGAASKGFVIEHNQNANLRPSDRMFREVCIHCHPATFSLASLADPDLVRRNFRGRPAPTQTSMTLIERETP
jgi:predicted CXXCH cytochrome family protein